MNIMSLFWRLLSSGKLFRTHVRPSKHNSLRRLRKWESIALAGWIQSGVAPAYRETDTATMAFG
jgi:hypothetical protein